MIVDVERVDMSSISPSVKRLKLPNPFNQPLDLLPPSLTHLVLGISFDLVISWLPPSLLALHFLKPSRFNHPISCLPPSLLRLEFGDHYDSSPYPLPDGLRGFFTRSKFNQEMDHLPSSRINFESITFQKQLPKLPSSLVKLSINDYPTQCTLDIPLWNGLDVCLKKRSPYPHL